MWFIQIISSFIYKDVVYLFLMIKFYKKIKDSAFKNKY